MRRRAAAGRAAQQRTHAREYTREGPPAGRPLALHSSEGRAAELRMPEAGREAWEGAAAAMASRSLRLGGGGGGNSNAEGCLPACRASRAPQVRTSAQVALVAPAALLLRGVFTTVLYLRGWRRTRLGGCCRAGDLAILPPHLLYV